MPLPVFPAGSLAESVITTVWLGAMVVIFFNSRFGWALSGIITPGYLAPLLILKPISVLVILVEGCITYFLAKLLFVIPARLGLWNQAFGRDRFFALILVAIIVRLSFDGYFLPWLGDQLSAQWMPLAWRSQFHSFGLIILALIANQFWKPGFTRGLSALVVCLGVTWFLTVFLLMRFTNFTISNVAYLYEDLAGSIAGSPKAYIILVIAGFLASRMNLKYGWEYNGILVPSFLALLWHQPQVILMTVLESFAILILAWATLQLPMMKSITIEGGRKLFFFFTIGFFYKMALAHGLALFSVTLVANDFFGFGYMLSTLMAMKMHQKEIPVFLTRSVLQVSLIAAVLGNILGYSMTRFSKTEPLHMDNRTRVESNDDTVLAMLRSLKQTLDQPGSPAGHERHQALETLLPSLWDDPNFSKLSAEGHQNTAHYQMSLLEGRFLCLRPRHEARGAIYVFNPQATQHLIVEVPFPRSEKWTLEAGWMLARKLDARLAVFGHGPKPLEGETLHIRAGNTEDILQIARDFPLALDLRTLDTEIDQLSYLWGTSTPSMVADAELFLTTSERRRLLLAAQASDKKNTAGRMVEHKVHPSRWLMARKENILPEGNEQYRSPGREYMVFFDSEVLRPLLRLIERGEDGNPIDEELTLIAGAASVLRYRLHRFRDGENNFLALAERGGERSRGRGTYVFRLGESEPLQIQIPRPLSEAGTAALGFALFDELRARSLLLAGSHCRPHPGMDSPTEKTSLFNLVYQADMRARGDRPLTAIQIRAAGYRDGPSVIFSATGQNRDEAVEPVEQFLISQNLIPEWSDGHPETAGYEALRFSQARYLDQTHQKGLVGIWLGPKARDRYRDRASNVHRRNRFKALGIATVNRNLAEWLPGQKAGRSDPRLIKLIANYQKTGDALSLYKTIQEGWRLTHVREIATRQSYLLVSDAALQPVLIANLDIGDDTKQSRANPANIRGLINRRTAMCLWRGP